LLEDFEINSEVIDHFSQLDDYDILTSIKVWSTHEDQVLRFLSDCIVNRRLFKIEISKKPFSTKIIDSKKKELINTSGFAKEDVEYLVFSDVLTNKAYNQSRQNINILMKSGDIVDLVEASDNLNISALAQPVEKYFLCYPE
jgi:hypothetical protein